MGARGIIALFVEKYYFLKVLKVDTLEFGK